MPETDKPLLTERFDKALLAATEIHRFHTRKGGNGEKPYLTHLLGVCAKVLDNGGSEDAAIAALLHDSIEDQPERLIRWGSENDGLVAPWAPGDHKADLSTCVDVLRNAFGRYVASIVSLLTDEKVNWNVIPRHLHLTILRENREKKFAKMKDPSSYWDAVVLVKAADIIDNATSLLHDYQKQGPDVWGNFRGGRDGTLWYYEEMVKVLEERKFLRLANDLRKIIGRIYDATTDERK